MEVEYVSHEIVISSGNNPLVAASLAGVPLKLLHVPKSSTLISVGFSGSGPLMAASLAGVSLKLLHVWKDISMASTGLSGE